VYDECVVASNQVLLVSDLEEVEDGDYSSSDTDSDDDVVDVQVPASCPVHDKVLEEHDRAVRDVQDQHADDDSDVPPLISSSEPPSSDDDGAPSRSTTARRQHVETPSDLPLCVPVQWLLNQQKFELYEEDEVEEQQDQGVQERSFHEAGVCHAVKALPGTFEDVLDNQNSNGQPDCRNLLRVFGLTATSKQRSQAHVAAHVDPTVVRFVLDSGCTQHIFNGNRDNFTNYTSKNQRICTANDKSGLSAAGVGDLPVIFTAEDEHEHPVTLKNVLWAPQAISSLLSISQAVRGGCTHGVDEDGAWLCLPPPIEEHVWADEEQGLYIVDAKLQLASPAVISLSADTTDKTGRAPTKEQVVRLALQIHASLGHLHWAAVKKLIKEGAISQLSKVSLTP